MLKRIGFVTIFMTCLLIIFGGYVASSNSGMGCGPDWPLCNGLFIPILKGATLIEFAHRFIGVILATITFVFFLGILRANFEKEVKRVAWGMISLLVVQVLLGAIVVFLDTPSIVVTIHLIVAMVYLFCTIWLWMKVKLQEGNRYRYSTLTTSMHQSAIKHLNNVIFLLLLLMGIGAYVKHQSYGLACSWLGCRENILPVAFPEIIQTIHRGLAVALGAYVIGLAYISIKNKWGKDMQRRMLLAAVSVIVQILIGIATIINFVEIHWAVLHLAVGTIVFTLISETRVYLGSQMVKQSIQLNKANQHQGIN